MKIKLVFLDWRRLGMSVYATEEGVELSTRDFHSGTTFSGKIELDAEQAAELARAIAAGFQPCFWIAQL